MKNKVVFKERGYEIGFEERREDGFWIYFRCPSKAVAAVNVTRNLAKSFIDKTVAECIEKGLFGTEGSYWLEWQQFQSRAFPESDPFWRCTCSNCGWMSRPHSEKPERRIVCPECSKAEPCPNGP